jgi:hypothetical protein
MWRLEHPAVVLAQREDVMTQLQAFVLMVGTLVIWGVYLFLFRRMVRKECALGPVC